MENKGYKQLSFKLFTTCEDCKKQTEVDDSKILTSFPPQYEYTCKHCGHVGYVCCSETYLSAPLEGEENGSN